MLLIKELNEEFEYITEDATEEKPKSYFIEGITMQSAVQNRNGRVYPEEILMREMTRYNETYVTKNRALGELGHPEGPTINLDRVSHMFTELRQESTNVVSRAKILDTPMGKLVKNYIDEGVQLGISSRGLGTLKMNKQGIMEVQSDFMLATAGDIVADPSGPNCFVNGIMENTEFYFDIASGHWGQKPGVVEAVEAVEEVIEEIVDEIKETYSKMTEADKFRLFEKFLNTLK